MKSNEKKEKHTAEHSITANTANRIAYLYSSLSKFAAKSNKRFDKLDTCKDDSTIAQLRKTRGASTIKCSKLHAHPPPSSISSPLGNFAKCVIRIHRFLCGRSFHVPPKPVLQSTVTCLYILSQTREATEITGISIEFLISQP